MSPRINYQQSAPKVFQSMLALHTATRRSSLSVELLDLIDYRVSLINRCAFCLGSIPRIYERGAKPSSGFI